MPDPVGGNIGALEATRFDQAMPPRGLRLAERARNLRVDFDNADNLVVTAVVQIPGGSVAGTAGDMSTTAVALVAAPAADRWIEVQHVTFTYDFQVGDTAYNQAGNVTFQYTGGAAVAATIPSMSTATAASTNSQRPIDVLVPLGTGLEVVTSADWHNGAGDVSVRVTVQYKVRGT